MSGVSDMPIWVEQADEYLKEHGALAATTEWEDIEEESMEQGIRPRVGEPIIVVGKRTGGEHVAHEIGHIKSGHRHPRSEIPEEAAKQELEAWLWAKRKRGGHLRTNIIERVIIGLMQNYPDVPEDDIVRVIRDAYDDLGERLPSEEYIQKVLERVIERSLASRG